MRNRLMWSFVLLLVACSTAIAAPTIEVRPSVAPVAADTSAPAAASATSPQTAAPTAAPTASTVKLPDMFERIADKDHVPPGGVTGMYRFYDQQAQVVCWIYGADQQFTGGDVAYSGMSCLPANQTALGK